MIKYQVEDYDQVIEEIKPLLDEHWEEVALFKEHIKLTPNYTMYEDLYNAGKLFIMTARDEDKLVGYNIMFLSNHPHYKDDIFAQQDLIYVDPKYRGTRVALKLVLYTENFLRDNMDVSVINYRMKLTHDYSRLLEKLGYKTVELSCIKYVKKEA